MADVPSIDLLESKHFFFSFKLIITVGFIPHNHLDSSLILFLFLLLLRSLLLLLFVPIFLALTHESLLQRSQHERWQIVRVLAVRSAKL